MNSINSSSTPLSHTSDTTCPIPITEAAQATELVGPPRPAEFIQSADGYRYTSTIQQLLGIPISSPEFLLSPLAGDSKISVRQFDEAVKGLIEDFFGDNQESFRSGQTSLEPAQQPEKLIKKYYKLSSALQYCRKIEADDNFTIETLRTTDGLKHITNTYFGALELNFGLKGHAVQHNLEVFKATLEYFGVSDKAITACASGAATTLFLNNDLPTFHTVVASFHLEGDASSLIDKSSRGIQIILRGVKARTLEEVSAVIEAIQRMPKL